MRQKIQDILQIITRHENSIEGGYQKINKDVNDWESLLNALIELFSEEEKLIKRKREKSYNVDGYENNVRKFAIELCEKLILEHDELQKYSSYHKLLQQKHMAYGFFKGIYYAEALGSETVKTAMLKIIKDVEFYKALYLGLTEFYTGFYGRFWDNEEAIELLCKYYPQEINLEEYEEKIVNALYPHISIAGTPQDSGYAYGGIALIESYIRNLPVTLVEKLIKRYRLYSIINDKVQRHQLFAEYGCLADAQLKYFSSGEYDLHKELKIYYT